MHKLLAAIDTTSLHGLRDRTLIAMMGYTFALVGGRRHEGPELYVESRAGFGCTRRAAK